MLEGIVLSNKSNLYKVEHNNEIYDCLARGKIKSEDISPVAGDLVEFEITEYSASRTAVSHSASSPAYTCY